MSGGVDVGIAIGRPRALIIGSDPVYTAIIATCLALADCQAQRAPTVEAGLRLLRSDVFDLVVLSLDSQNLNRTKDVNRVRSATPIPVIALEDVFEASRHDYEAGADNVLPNPLHASALVGLIQATLRNRPRSLLPLASRLEVLGVVFDRDSRAVDYHGQTALLTKREWELLSFFLANPDRYVSAIEILERAWAKDAHRSEQLRTYIGRLRAKLAPLELPFQLVTEHGRGYRFVISGEERSRSE